MGKINVRVHRKDQAIDDHCHKLPNGSYTGGCLYKPNKDRTFPHSHLYQGLNGQTLETSQCAIGGDHTHVTELGISSGPMPIRKDSAERKDFVIHEGSRWLVKSETGRTLGSHPTKEAANKQLAAVEANK